MLLSLRLILLSALASGISIGANAFLGDSPAELDLASSTRLLDEVDYSWMSGYTLMYENCFVNDGTVTFRLCPKGDGCNHRDGCSGGGEYAVEFYTFLDAFTEAKLGAREYACEMVRENCDNDDEDACYEDSGLDYCGDQDDEFDLQDYIDGCAQFGDYYIAPYCASDAYSIHLGLYTDEDCTTFAADGTYYDLYGEYLPYSAETGDTVVGNGCANCKEHGKDEDQNDGDQADEDDVLEQCEELYEESTKCMDDVDSDVSNPDTSGCGTISTMVSQEAAIASAASGTSNASLEILIIILLILVVGCCIFQVWFCRYLSIKDSKKAIPEDGMETEPPSKENLIEP